MRENMHIVISEHNIIEFTELGQVDVDGEVFTAIHYRHDGSLNWHLGLSLEPNSDCDGCDVEEIDELTALKIMGELFNVHIYENLTGVSRL